MYDQSVSEAMNHDSTDLFERLFSTIHIAIAYMDCDFTFIRVNHAYAAADKREPSFFVGKNHFDLYPYAENEAIFRQVVATGQAYTDYAKAFVYTNNPERGTTYWDWTLQPIIHITGRIEGLVLSLIDVTQRVLSEQELHARREYFRVIADFTHDWEFWLNPDQSYRYVSPSCLRITGYPPEAFMDDPGLLKRIIHADDRKRVMDHLRLPPRSFFDA
ncbi:MAG: PAS domain-containing protein [Chloroflexaceae bacterium]|nr:PAS domain-containing protein [Chloroflexaceae bacterium]